MSRDRRHLTRVRQRPSLLPALPLRSELAWGLPELELGDGRADHALCPALRARGLDLANGAVLLEGDQAWHGAAPPRGRLLDPLILAARGAALRWTWQPVDHAGGNTRQAPVHVR